MQSPPLLLTLPQWLQRAQWESGPQGRGGQKASAESHGMQTQPAARNSEAGMQVSQPPKRDQGVGLSLSGAFLSPEAAWLGFANPLPSHPLPPLVGDY